MWNFKPVDVGSGPTIEVPSFEDARADFAPYYGTTLKITEAQIAINVEIAKLGGMVVSFKEGELITNGTSRFAYEIRFVMGERFGVLRVAALPITKAATADKVRRAKVQALLNLRDWLKSAVTQQVFLPNLNPLLQHLIAAVVEGTGRELTVADYMDGTAKALIDSGATILQLGNGDNG